MSGTMVGHVGQGSGVRVRGEASMVRLTVKWVNKGYLHHTGTLNWTRRAPDSSCEGDTHCDNYSSQASTENN